MRKSLRKYFWLPAIAVVLLLGLSPKPTFAQGATPCDSVAEASSYTLVYSLNIPTSANYNAGLPPYSVNNTASIGSFDRVAYCVQLDSNWIWVSLDAFTAVPAQVGVPVISTGAVFQQIVSNMNVASNVPSIISGTGIATGNIEFWHHCYGTGNEIGIPGASGSVYDFGDDNSGQSGSCYGSMQLHNYGAGQTLFAYNRWDQGGSSDLGIGNSPAGHPDWTFRFNAEAYAVRTMNILVRSDSEGPITSSVVASPNPASVSQSITLTAHIDDATTGGSTIASADFEIRDGAAVMLSGTGAGTCSNSQLPCPDDTVFDQVDEDVAVTIDPGDLTPGVYSACVRGTDANGNTGAFECIYLVVYDPDGGFVTGGGWITSPEGASTAFPLAVGKANFGFVSKYLRGATIPTGQTQFQFKAGDLNFHSTEYEWLVVGGPLAQYKGSGTINGSGDYGFLLRATDGALNAGGPDKFRIMIWDKATEATVYDNGNDLEIGGGSIVIHTR